MIIYYTILILMTCLGSVAALFLKKASRSENVFKMLFNCNLYIGAGLYLISSVLNIWVIKYLNYSVVLPLTSITYIWTMVLSYWILKEKITKKKVFGIGLIVIGAIIVTI